jgi:hypothetical protein
MIPSENAAKPTIAAGACPALLSSGSQETMLPAPH